MPTSVRLDPETELLLKRLGAARQGPTNLARGHKQAYREALARKQLRAQ